ncbi:MAG TPA: arginase family protein [Dongiaceae bacterium]|jgi:arginase family enzyme|nr:arginase family protein [Dongiaceae bacterium]
MPPKGKKSAPRKAPARTSKAAIAAAFQRASAKAAQSPYRVVRRVERILYDDVPTFMEAPYADEAPDADVVVVGLPYEGVKILDPRRFLPAQATHQADIYSRTGATGAPAAIRRNAIYYSLDHSGGLFPERGPDYQIADWCKISDGGDIRVDYEIDAETMLHKAGDRIERLIGRDKVLILLGGDDTIPYVGVRSVARQRKQRIAVLKFDSHYDLAWEPRYWAGSQWARCFEGGYLDPVNFAEIGIRGTRNSLAWHEAARELDIGIWTLQDVEEKGIRQCVREALARICRGVDALYLSLDLDVIDPAFLPAQKYPDPAGLTAREILQALRLAIEEGPEVVGFDMACLGPDFDLNGLGAQLAARCAVEVIGGLGWKKAQAAAQRSKRR